MAVGAQKIVFNSHLHMPVASVVIDLKRQQNMTLPSIRSFIMTFSLFLLSTTSMVKGHIHEGDQNSLPSSVNNNNSSSQADRGVDKTVVLAISFLIPIVLIGVTGNILVIYFLACRRRSATKLVYETFCVGLAITDLVFLGTACPITITQYLFMHWIYGAFLCKAFNFIVLVTVFSSSFVLLCLTASRFLAVVFPWQNLKITELRAKLFCLGAWAAGMTFAAPILVYQTIEHFPVKSSPTPANDSQTPDAVVVKNLTVPICRTILPGNQEVTYQLIVLLTTYVIPFWCILIMNSAIIYKLQRESAIEKRRRKADQQKSRLTATNSIVNKQMAHDPKNQSAPPTPTHSTLNPNNNQLAPGDNTLHLISASSSTTLQADKVKARRMEKQRKQRARATILVVLVTTLWCSCWLPIQVINSWFFFDPESFPMSHDMKIAKLIAQLLSFTASCVNPIVYGIMTGTFKSTLSATKWPPNWWLAVVGRRRKAEDDHSLRSNHHDLDQQTVGPASVNPTDVDALH